MSNHPSLDAYDDLFKLEEGEELSLYTARDRSRDKKVALWVWKRKREQVESEEAVDLNHPLLSPVLRTGVDSGESFLVQELPEGRSLAKLLKEEDLPISRTLRIIAQVASILTEIHRNGNVHGNLSPWSIFVSDDGKVRLLGVGMTHLLGDPAYISPEKAREQTLTPSSDIFSLGTILYESLTGFRPFRGETRLEVRRALVHSPTPRMKIGRAHLPREVVRLTETCLAKDPDARYKDADVFLEALMSLAFEPPHRLGVPRPRLRRFAAVGFLLSGLFLVIWHFVGGPRGASSVDDAGPYSHWRRVAVMKPEYVGEHATRPFLVQGVEDEIVSALTTNTTLDVISTLSTRVYRDSEKSARQIAEELMAGGLIESTVFDDGERMSLHIRLADGETGDYLWDHRLEITRETIVEIQDRLEAILYSEFRSIWVRTAEHLERASTVEAYTLFLEAKQLYNRYTENDNRKAIKKLQNALNRDSSFAPGWAALARAYGNVVNVEESTDESWLNEAESAAERAIELAPHLPDGYYARGSVHYLRSLYFGADIRSKAERDFDRALTISPDYPDALLARAFLLFSRGIELDDASLTEASLVYFQRALTLQPNLPNAEANYAYALTFTGQAELAANRLTLALSNNSSSPHLHIALGNICLFRGNALGAIEVTEDAMRSDILSSSLHRARLAAFHAAAGDAETASEILGDVNGPFESNEDFYMASALAGIGLEDKALARLRDWNQRMGGRHEQLGLFRWWLRKDPNFRALRESGALEPFLG